MYYIIFFLAEDGIRDHCVTGVQTCALPISRRLALNALLAVLLGAVLAVAPATVAAHSLLLEASPAADALLPEPPTEIALRLNNRVEKRLCTLLLVDGHGDARRADMRADGPPA